MAIKIGVDTGGTFSDFMLMDGDTLVIHKVLSTPENPARAVLQGLRHLRPVLTGVAERWTHKLLSIWWHLSGTLVSR